MGEIELRNKVKNACIYCAKVVKYHHQLYLTLLVQCEMTYSLESTEKVAEGLSSRI